MKLKILAIGSVLILTVSNFFVSANTDAGMDTKTTNVVNNIETKNIRVAILGEEPFPILGGSGKWLFPLILNYSWVVGNRSYKFITTPIFDKDIIKGELNTDNYDVLVGPGGSVGDGESITKGFYRLPKVKEWKENIAEFVKDGGGYCGYCGGTALFTEFSKKPTTFLERQYDKSAIGVSCVKSYYKDIAIPILYPFQRLYPDKIGAAWYVFTGPGPIPMETQIYTDNPVFDDFIGNTEFIDWQGGPALVLPDNPDRNVYILARYPIKELSENEFTRIHAWKYTGGFLGIIRGFFNEINFYRNIGKDITLKELLFGSLYYATDWKKTDKLINLNFSNKPCMTAEVYPNENQGRILLTGLHPEFPMSGFGGHIVEAKDTVNNSLHEGLIKWVDRIPWNETPEDEFTYTWWIVRRNVAWAAKIPDNDLPPVYGPSQVSDIYPYTQSSVFTVIGNAEIANGTVSLDLYYRHLSNNASWSCWTLYKTDNDISDGWSWEFNASKASGSGYYQFYSIRHVKYENEELIETAPPGPDAMANVSMD